MIASAWFLRFLCLQRLICSVYSDCNGSPRPRLESSFPEVEFLLHGGRSVRSWCRYVCVLVQMRVRVFLLSVDLVLKEMNAFG